jgi:hypothetical protein
VLVSFRFNDDCIKNVLFWSKKREGAAAGDGAQQVLRAASAAGFAPDGVADFLDNVRVTILPKAEARKAESRRKKKAG